MAAIEDTEQTSTAATAQHIEPAKSPDHGTLRKMIASGKSIPSKACTR